MFPSLPSRVRSEPLFEDGFIGVARPDHPALRRTKRKIRQGPWLSHPHLLVTTGRDASGITDRVLGGLQRRIGLTTPHMLTLPALLMGSDLLAVAPMRLARRFSELRRFEVPVEIPRFTVHMAWSERSDSDPRSQWLRKLVREATDSEH